MKTAHTLRMDAVISGSSSIFRLIGRRDGLCLFGFRPNLALHLARSLSNHSYGYGFSTDRASCFASLSLIPEPFVKYAG